MVSPKTALGLALVMLVGCRPDAPTAPLSSTETDVTQVLAASQTSVNSCLDASASLHVFPPLGASRGNAVTAAAIDPVGHEYLLLSICKTDPAGGCTLVEELTMEALEAVGLRDNAFHVNWEVPDGGGEFRFTFSLAFPASANVPPIILGAYTLRANAGRTLPIKFQLDGLSLPVLAHIWTNVEGRSPEEVEQALIDRGADPQSTAAALYCATIPGTKACQVLKQSFGMEDPDELAAVLGGAGYEEPEYIGCSHLKYATRFAPILAFDRSGRGGFPMDAQEFFEDHYNYFPLPVFQTGMVLGPTGFSINPTRAVLHAGEVPTYFRVRSEPSGQLWLDYWWFYGYQFVCNLPVPFCPAASGSNHEGDWERVIVITNQARSRVAAVIYYQHGARYTKTYGVGQAATQMRPGIPHFEYVWDSDSEIGDYERPIAYVGMHQHGSYDNMGGTAACDGVSGCDIFQDLRNPIWDDPDYFWWTSTGPLVDLNGYAQPWLEIERDTWPWSIDHRPAWSKRQTGDVRIVRCGLTDCTWNWGEISTHPTWTEPRQEDNSPAWPLLTAKDKAKKCYPVIGCIGEESSFHSDLGISPIPTVDAGLMGPVLCQPGMGSPTPGPGECRDPVHNIAKPIGNSASGR